MTVTSIVKKLIKKRKIFYRSLSSRGPVSKICVFSYGLDMWTSVAQITPLLIILPVILSASLLFLIIRPY